MQNSKKDPLYNYLTPADFSQIDRTYLPFTISETSKLSSLFNLSTNAVCDLPYFQKEHIDHKLIQIMGVDVMQNGLIRKLEDEWYLFFYKSRTYQCDQLEGLIQCIKDNNFLTQKLSRV